LQSLPVQRAEELEAAFDRAVRERVQGMVVLSSRSSKRNEHKSPVWP